MKINQHYTKLAPSYLFREVAARVAEHEQATGRKAIRLGIGDVTLPLPNTVAEAFAAAAREMGQAATFRGYPPEQGYPFLREAVSRYHTEQMGVAVDPDEIFISDGAKTELSSILDLFAQENTALVPDPVYPVYADTNIMDGRKILYLKGSESNGFLPLPDDLSKEERQQADLIYLCSPGNPTGAVYSRDQLKAWVDFANERDALILFDAAYEAFIREDRPRSIYQIPGARQCSIEIGSFSKMAGFTGVRCAFTVIPRELKRDGMSLHSLYFRRQSTKMNGVSYPVQRAAEAALTPEGQEGCRRNLAVYQENAFLMAATLTRMGVWFTGGVNSPYLWMRVPSGMSSWDFFDDLLARCDVVGTPGSGFGPEGEGYFRLTAFGTPEATAEAMRRMEACYAGRF